MNVRIRQSAPAKINALRELQSASGEELGALCYRPCWTGRSKVNYDGEGQCVEGKE